MVPAFGGLVGTYNSQPNRRRFDSQNEWEFRIYSWDYIGGVQSQGLVEGVLQQPGPTFRISSPSVVLMSRRWKGPTRPRRWWKCLIASRCRASVCLRLIRP